jgi:hypothetical protein
MSFPNEYSKIGRAGSPLAAANTVNYSVAARTEWRTLPDYLASA